MITWNWNLFRSPIKAWSLQYIFADQRRKSTNAILFDDCFISQIIIKQFQSSSESSNIILLAIKPNKRHFKYYWNSFVLSKCTINCAFVRYLSDFVSSFSIFWQVNVCKKNGSRSWSLWLILVAINQNNCDNKTGRKQVMIRRRLET